jgi:Carboxypeptidase regulatory-like domain
MRVFRGTVGRTLLVIAVGFFLESVPAFSENSFGSIVETVTDRTGAAVPGATVLPTNDATGEGRTSSTDASGCYPFVSLKPDNYKLDIEGTGFKHYPRDPITVQVDQTFHQNATMEVGAVSHEVVVTSQAPIVQTESYWQSLRLSPPEGSQKRKGSALGPSIEVSEPIFDSEVSHV